MMSKRIRSMIDEIFSEMKMTVENLALRDELMANAQARYEDAVAQGKSEEEAFAEVAASLGDVQALLREMNAQPEEKPHVHVKIDIDDNDDNDDDDDDEEEDEEDDDDDDGDPADLPFAMPEFTWLPEGYELDDSYISEYGYASLYFEYTGDDDEYHSTLYVDLSEASSSSSVNYTLSGESLDEPVITIEREDGCIDALAILNGVEVSVTYYDEDLTDEDILSFFAGIVTE